jgi:hypothetical protein
MERYGILYLEKNSLYNVNIGLKKGTILVESTYEDNFSNEIFKTTPFGAYPQDQRIFSEKFEALLKDKKIKKWCLLLPDFWQKSLLLEEENIPKNPKEVKTFIEWYFKKSYNLKPEEVRFSYILKNQNGNNKILINFCLEKLLSSIELIFKKNNKHLGFIISTFWALSFLVPKRGRWALLNIEKDTWTLGIFEENNLINFRQKIFPFGNPSFLIEEVERTIKLNEKPLDFFYFNLANSEIRKEDLLVQYNFLKPYVENIKFLKEPPIWWENLGSPFLGVLYGLP